MNDIVAYVAVFLACLARTTLPYWYKSKQNGQTTTETVKFDVKYLYAMISALVTSFVMASLMYPSIQLPDVTASNLLGFVTVFASAWGITDIFNKLGIDVWKKPTQ